MEKTEFLDQLRQSLAGNMEADKAADHVRYYEDYINTQVRMGKSESAVLDSLGSPRLIARTIADTHEEVRAESGYSRYDSGNFRSSERERQEWGSQGNYEVYGASGPLRVLNSWLKLPRWGKWLIGVLVVSVVLWLIFSVLAFLAPVLVPMMIVLFLFKFFKDWLK